MSLYLYSFQPDIGRLMRLAAREHLLAPGDDPGYAIHAVLAASFGALAPRPWILLPAGRGGGPAGRILAYGAVPLSALRDHAATFADPAFAAPLVLEHAESRPMPLRFASGTRLGFRVRVRPVVRTGKPVAGHPSAIERGDRCRERDAYLARIAAAARDTAHASTGDSGPTLPARACGIPAAVPTRATCYLEWVDARLRDAGAAIAQSPDENGAPTVLAAGVEAFRITRLMSRDRRNGRSRSQHPRGPDATVTGTLVVNNSERFLAGLARGIGRFRAFGFGMLLLSPPRD